MKKMFLLGAFVAAGFVSANNSIVKDTKVTVKSEIFQECSVRVRFYNAEGQYVGTQTFTSDQPTLSDCQSYQNAVKRFVKDLGYSLSE